MINLTQHSPTQEQMEAGVVEAKGIKTVITQALTFDTIPSQEEMEERAELLSSLVLDTGDKEAMIGGAPFFMSTLEKVLLKHGIQPYYAFSQREAVDVEQEDGSVKKVSVFKHKGFVKAGEEQ